MSMLSFDKLLKIISTVLSILSYALGLLNDGQKPSEDSE